MHGVNRPGPSGGGRKMTRYFGTTTWVDIEGLCNDSPLEDTLHRTIHAGSTRIEVAIGVFARSGIQLRTVVDLLHRNRPLSTSSERNSHPVPRPHVTYTASPGAGL